MAIDTARTFLFYQSICAAEAGVKTKLAVFKSVFVPILTYGHEPWVMTERTRSRIRAAEMAFLRRISGLTMLDRVRSSEIRETLRVEPLLLQIERSQLRWMSSDRAANRILKTHPTGRRPRGRPRTRLSDYIQNLVQSRLGISPDVLPEVASEKGHWREDLLTLTSNTYRD
ncbi:Uncharacterised protein r2_g3579 [Pycnogonum litorale]